MNRLTFFEIVKQTIGSISWSIFLWSTGHTEDEYFEAIYFQEKAYRKSNNLPLEEEDRFAKKGFI